MKEKDDLGQPSTTEVIEEARRRQRERRPQASDTTKFVVAADRFAFWLSKHWLGIFNMLAFLYVGLPFLAPTLMHLGAETPEEIAVSIMAEIIMQRNRGSIEPVSPRPRLESTSAAVK